MSQDGLSILSGSPVAIDTATYESSPTSAAPETVICTSTLQISGACGGDAGSPRSSGCVSSDEAKGEDDELIGFEGPEKVLELEFSVRKGPARGLREVTREQWDLVLGDAKCSILCTLSNDHFDSYVLSESSLFVYPHTALLKTCGTTTLLRCIPRLLEYTAALGMELEWVGYTRKNFNFPHKQLFPHSSPEDEVKFLKGMFDQWNIEAFVLGPITGDHWYVIIADHSNRPAETSFDRTIDLMMFDMDPAVSANFMHTPEDVVHKDVTLKAGIDTIMPAAEIQEWAFSPCGYSCNAMLGDAYHTIHITPEPHCSYASFETNIKLPSYNKIIQRVLDLFRPKRFTLTVFADREGVAQCTDTPYTTTYDSSNPDFVYVLSSRSHAEAGDYRSFLGNYRLKRRDDPTSPTAISRTTSFNAFFSPRG